MKQIQPTIIVQARLGSARFPRKCLKSIGHFSAMELLIKRLNKSRLSGHIVFAIPDSSRDDELYESLDRLGAKVFRGSEQDVLDRYYKTAKLHEADHVVRITGDCPFIDGSLIDHCIEQYRTDQSKLICNNDPPTIPDGLDCEIFSFEHLAYSWRNAEDPFDREHVTPFIKKHYGFRNCQPSIPNLSSKQRITLDYKEDLVFLNDAFDRLGNKENFSLAQLTAVLNSNLLDGSIHQNYKRNEGAIMKQNNKLWHRANASIIGGNSLFSKNPNLHSPDDWPTYYTAAFGCEIQTVEGARLLDMSYMGIGTNFLGYGNKVVDAAVAEVVKSGNLTTLNSVEEIDLAELLVSLHPWSSKVKFARSGAEANSIAIRLARATSGRDKIVFCGYHGWHDWYISAALGGSNVLSSHLMRGLSPSGIPTHLEGTTTAVAYNDREQLEKCVSQIRPAAIIMEVERNIPPAPGYLEFVRDLADRNGTLLIFDECTTGFRENMGGLHLKYGINPDIATYGKTLGNGYAITATLVNERAAANSDDCFISSTFWSERIGFAAGIATLSEFNRVQPFEDVKACGLYFRQQLQNLAQKSGLELKIQGIPALTTFALDIPNWPFYKSYFVSEMLKSGILASSAFYASVPHTNELVDKYMLAALPIFEKISEHSAGGNDVQELGVTPTQVGFSRMN